MLYTLTVVLLILWLLGMISTYTVHGFIHLLLFIAVILFFVRFLSGRNPA